ncbi:uncharacterized protein LOC127080585 [Lathyrus oleraceus]|uniref:uncharacterized protein LOC127080585 n=1 Tax=Pisum sativum TaxID=3888 RepID=UPI0021CED6AE|nr:uncharacterized protein LOC127080585 [Pisum sativum]
MTLNIVQPKNILATLKRNKPGDISTIKKMYNICVLNNKALRMDRTKKFRTCDDGVTVRDIFWTHPDSKKLFNIFLIVLIIDSTYKTHKYRLPLLEIVGVTSTEKTYFVGFAFLRREKEKNLT